MLAPWSMPSGKIEHHPGLKPLQGSAAIMSQAGLHACAGSAFMTAVYTLAASL